MEKIYKPMLATWLIGLVMAFFSVFSTSAFSEHGGRIDTQVSKSTIKNSTPIHLNSLTQHGTLPQWRSSGVFARVENKVYLWGGYVQCFTPGCSQAFPTTLQTYNLSTATWNVETQTGGPPPGRTYHSMDVWIDTHFVKHIIVYGGLDFEPDFSRFISYGDMWDFNTATNTWTQISAAATPGKRFGASFQIVGQTGYLFAGVEDLGGFNFVEHNDLWLYNFTTGTWTHQILDDPAENPVNQPGSRYRANFDHSILMNAIVMFGGDRLVLPGQADKPHRHDTWLLQLDGTAPTWVKKSDEVDAVIDPVSGVLGTQHVVAFGDLEPQDSSLRCCSAPPGDPTRFCDDAVKNIYSNTHINQAGSHYTKFDNVTGTTALKRSAYVKIGDKILIWGGYNLQCSAPGADDGVLQFNTNLLSLNMLDLIQHQNKQQQH